MNKEQMDRFVAKEVEYVKKVTALINEAVDMLSFGGMDKKSAFIALTMYFEEMSERMKNNFNKAEK